MTPTGALSSHDCRQDPDGHVLGTDVIRDHRAHRCGVSIVHTGRTDETTSRLAGQVSTFARCRRTLGAECGAHAIDDARVAGRSILVPHTPFVECSRLKVRDHHVGGLDQFQERLGTVGQTQVKRDAALASIVGNKIRRPSVFCRDRNPPRLIAQSRHFDLDDIGAHINQGLPSLRSLHDDARIDYPNSVKCSHNAKSRVPDLARHTWRRNLKRTSSPPKLHVQARPVLIH